MVWSSSTFGRREHHLSVVNRAKNSRMSPTSWSGTAMATMWLGLRLSDQGTMGFLGSATRRVPGPGWGDTSRLLALVDRHARGALVVGPRRGPRRPGQPVQGRIGQQLVPIDGLLGQGGLGIGPAIELREPLH